MEESLTRGQRNVGDDQHGPLLTFFNRRRLSPTQRRLARYIIDHPYEGPFLSSVELAKRVEVSQPSVTRLATALGYKRFGDMQGDLRRLVLSAEEARADEAGNKFQTAVAAEISNLRALEDYLADPSTVLSLGHSLAGSEPLCVLGLRVSAPLAIYFGYVAEKIHPDVRILTDGGSTVFDQLAHARHAGGEWVLCFLLPRHPRETLEAIRYAKFNGFRIATVTDHAPQSIIDMSDIILPAEVGTQLVFDSQATAMVLAGALLEAVADASSNRTQTGLENFEQRAAKLELFVTE